MIIACENCRAKFNLDEGLISESGSKVRCSQCKHVFTAYPPGLSPADKAEPDRGMDEDLEETVALDAPPIFEEEETESDEEDIEAGFDEVFRKALEDDTGEAISSDEFPLEEEGHHMEEAIDRAEGVEEEIAREGIDREADGELEEAEGALVAPPAEKKSGGLRVLLIILAVILVLVAGAAAVFLLAPGILPEPLRSWQSVKEKSVSDTGIRRLTFKDVNGSFVQSDKGEQRFVIKGVVTNNNPENRSYIRVKGSIIDDKGQVVTQKLAYAGNTFSEQAIKEMPMEEIDEGLKNRFGEGRTNVNVIPGGDVPFMIIFENLPKNLSEFTVEAVGSSLKE